MKKLFYFASIAFLCSCGGSSTEGTGETADSTKTAETGTPVDNSIIDPLKDDLSAEINAADLINSMSVYYGKEIQLVVYPHFTVEGTKFVQGQYCEGTLSEAFYPEKHVSVTFTNLPDEVIVKGQAYLIKGKISEIGFYNELIVEEAELLAMPADVKIESFNPKSISSTALYNPVDIISSIMAWDKKMITVAGDYWGTTISKSYDQTQLLDARVDLGTTDAKVGCSFATEEEAQAFQTGQTNVKIKGELQAKLTFGSPTLKNCTTVQ
jgi:hypothetical protein